MKKKNPSPEVGSLMLIVMAFMLIFTSIIGAWLSATVTDSGNVTRKVRHTSALYLAEAGAEHAKEWVTEQVQLTAPSPGDYYASTIFQGEQLTDLGQYAWIAALNPNDTNWLLNFGTSNHYYTAKVNVADDGFHPPVYTIVAWGLVDPDGTLSDEKDDEIVRKEVVRAQLGSYARYAYYTEREANIWFITMDVLRGPTHTNSLDPNSTPENPIFNSDYSYHFAGKPDFWGKVTTTADEWTFYASGKSSNPSEPPDIPNFRDGYELEAAYVPYPTDTDRIEQAAQGPFGLIIPNDTEITLSVDVGDIGKITYTEEEEQQVWHDPVTHYHGWWGWHAGIFHWWWYAEWHTHDGYWSTETVTVEHEEEVYDEQVNPDGKAVVYVQGDAQVQGQLAGQLTILTEGDIWIEGDITYNVNPVDYDGDGLLSDGNNNSVNDPAADRTGDGDTNDPGEEPDDTDDDGDGQPDMVAYDQPESTDSLGLVSKGDAIVADDHGPAINREIDASIMALGVPANRDGKFYVEDYADHLEGTLTVVGGIVQQRRGPVGTFNGDIYGEPQKTSGYSKNYIYDPRLLYTPPPYFPPIVLLDLIYWQEVPYWSSD